MPVICEVMLALVVITAVGAILAYHFWSLIFRAPTYIQAILEREAEKREEEKDNE